MLQESRAPRAALLLVSLFFLSFSLFINLPVLHQGFLFADQAVYYAMAQSIAFDGDLEYTKKDFLRYKEDFDAGPMGIFLKRVKKDGDEKLYFAKNFAYPLFAAPFVRVFGYNGPLVFHAVLLFLLLRMGYSYFSLANSRGLSLLHILTFLFASVAGVYFLWIAPDFFNLFLVFTVLFLWLFKRRKKDQENPAGGTLPGRFQRFLLSRHSDFLAAFIAGIAVYSKPPNVAVMGPLLFWSLLKKKYVKSGALVLCFALSLGLLFGTTYLMTSDWNYQGGERKSFYYSFPYEREGLTFDTAQGGLMTSEGYFGRFLLPFKFVPYNIYYYFFGRFTGIVWYFFPAFLFLILFLLGKKSLDQWLILAALAGEILIYIIIMPDNYGGGGGSLANRYFLNIYPLFLFLPGMKIKYKEFVLSWIMASIFIGQILVSPVHSSARPATHAKRLPFTLLPVEKTLINNIPTNTNPNAMRQQWGHPPNPDRFLYFLNDNFNAKHPDDDGWWTLGDKKADIMLRTFFPVKEIVVHLLNNPRLSNEISVSVDGAGKKIILGPKQRGSLHFPVGRGFQIRESHQYRLKIKAAKGSIPYYESEASQEKRWLGVFFELELIPR
jgi:hypothetical protein